MKNLLACTTIILTIVFSINADPIEVVISGKIENVVTPGSGIDLSGYVGQTVTYSFIYDTDQHGTRNNIFQGEYDYNDNGFNAFYAALSSDLIIENEPERTPVDYDLNYGFISEGNTYISIGPDNTRYLQLSFDQEYTSWVADDPSTGLNEGTASIEIKEWIDNGNIRGSDFHIVSMNAAPPSSVPEPSTLTLLLSSFSMLGIGFITRRKK